MTDVLYFAPLDSSDAKDIQRLQKRCFPSDLREDYREIKAILLRTEEHVVCNFSFAVYAGKKMVGYVFAYLEARSLYHDREEEVLYVKEIGLLPGNESALRRLFLKLFQLWSAYIPDTPFEAHVQEDSLRNWKRMVRLFRHYGLTLSTRREQNEDSRLPYQLLRLDVDTSTASLYDRPMALPSEQWRSSDGLSVTVLTDVRQWLSMKRKWEQLVSETEDANVSQSFENRARLLVLFR